MNPYQPLKDYARVSINPLVFPQNPHNSSTHQGLSPSSLYRWGNWSPEKWWDLLTVTKPISSCNRIQAQLSTNCSPSMWWRELDTRCRSSSQAWCLAPVPAQRRSVWTPTAQLCGPGSSLNNSTVFQVGCSLLLCFNRAECSAAPDGHQLTSRMKSPPSRAAQGQSQPPFLHL
jgi:hypothetical protein